jgi:hypothetical protein
MRRLIYDECIRDTVSLRASLLAPYGHLGGTRFSSVLYSCDFVSSTLRDIPKSWFVILLDDAVNWCRELKRWKTMAHQDVLLRRWDLVC